jgi:hypothetical protein
MKTAIGGIIAKLERADILNCSRRYNYKVL